ncbi:patatin-like phospholipase family protein [Methyloversatilis thermotolerans]|uniref:patatin-like phospholipase family protein n=1 Tax=Methyloversatilis thermotolerans TaxID=1346290 RepID=UPI000374543B|nr:patatin-like phospholipase family protein [Methyloversatilis thermotolerans]
MSGGGARAAYQVGVLAAVRELLPDARANPFPILCGTSAGAINATALAVYSEHFGDAVDKLLHIWRNFEAGQVYRADTWGIGKTGARWLLALMFGWAVDRYPRSLLDNSPLRALLEQVLDFSRIDRALHSGALYALSVTASGYTSGDSVAFFAGGEGIEPWKRMQRASIRTALKVEHLLASSALPFIFPAVKLNREYFGDGSMRQLAPVSPAVHLGAERIFIIGVGRMNEADQRRRSGSYPSLAQVAGHALASIFLDQLMIDIEQLQRVNDILGRVSPDMQERIGAPLRPIETLVISPSERLDDIAARHVAALPIGVRTLLGGIGGTRRAGGGLASYLLFEKPFTRALIDLGYRDVMARADDVRAFLGVRGS